MDGKILHFEFRGLYDGVSFLSDRETQSFWHHVTGEAMHGPLRGRRLPVGNLLHMTVRQALAAAPDALIALSDRPLRGQLPAFWPWLERVPVLGERFRRTMARTDTRRPELDIGLGIWNQRVQRYYPLETLRAANNVILDTLDGQRILLVFEAGASAPQVFFTRASAASWRGDTLALDDGSWLRHGVLYDRNGDRLSIARPLQLFTRWYGWVLMFPKTEIYR